MSALLLAVALALASWAYDIGRRFAGFDKTVAEQEVLGLRNQVESLEVEMERLRRTGTGSEASLQIDQTLMQKLGEQVKRLELENSRLREEVAVFENLFSGETKSETIHINHLQVAIDPAVAGGYRYRLLLTAPASRADRVFRGKLQLIAMVQRDGREATMNLSDVAQLDTRKLQVDFKYFHRVEGGFTLPPHTDLKRFEARLMQDSTVVATQQITL